MSIRKSWTQAELHEVFQSAVYGSVDNLKFLMQKHDNLCRILRNSLIVWAVIDNNLEKIKCLFDLVFEDNKCCMAMFVACLHARTEIIKFLINKGVRVTSSDIRIAEEKGHTAIINLFMA